MNKYSVILRAYNAAGHVSKSIESIIQQSYANWELIIVNDGSTDATGEICDNFALKDQRIRVVHQENRGCLLATQTGVQCATGEYICLVDSDDWYEPDYLDKVNYVFCNQKVDMVVTNYKIISSDHKEKMFYLVEEDFIADTKDAMRLFLQTTNYALWNKVIAKEKIRYTEEEQTFYNTSGKSTNFGDDLFLLMPVLCGCERIYFLSDCLYNYIIYDTSISHQAVKDNWKELAIRNRLMEFTYNAINNRDYMDKGIKRLIQMNSVRVLMPNIFEIVKNKKIDKETLRQLKSNSFYNKIVLKAKVWEIKRKFGKKRAIIFFAFKIINMFG